MFGKHHIKIYEYTYVLITEAEGYWIEEGQIKKLEQEWERDVCILTIGSNQSSPSF